MRIAHVISFQENESSLFTVKRICCLHLFVSEGSDNLLQLFKFLHKSCLNISPTRINN